MLLEILILIFLAFVFSRTFLRWWDGQITFFEFLAFSLLWVGVGVVVVVPESLSSLAGVLGVGRGSDVAVYLALLLLFYALFRVIVKLAFIEHEITKIVRLLAIEKSEKNDDNKHQS